MLKDEIREHIQSAIVRGPFGRLVGMSLDHAETDRCIVKLPITAAVVNTNGIVHGGIGRVGFGGTEIKENIEALITDLKKAKPASAKGTYLKKVVLSTTMGAGILIDQASLDV